MQPCTDEGCLLDDETPPVAPMLHVGRGTADGYDWTEEIEAAEAEPLNGDASNVVPKEPADLAPSSPADWRARAG